MKAIETDPSGAVVNQAITILRTFRHKDALTGLIECLDSKFEGKGDWKRASSPEGFRRNIAETLQKLTGAEIGPDKAEWLKWWSAHAEAVDLTKVPKDHQ